MACVKGFRVSSDSVSSGSGHDERTKEDDMDEDDSCIAINGDNEDTKEDTDECSEMDKSSGKERDKD